jgi:flagellar assembly protein FliH
MSEFVAGFAVRHQAPADVLARAFAAGAGFAAGTPVRASGPKHFSPADRKAKPTEGWDPLDPTLEPQFEAALPDPELIEAARQAGYAEGLAAARAALGEAAARDQALLHALAERLGAGAGVDRNAVAARLRATVLHLVTQLVGEVGVAPDRLAARVEAAADLLAEKSESALLRVHPDDVALLDGRLPQSIFPVGDPAVTRGSFVLESASTVVEDGPELWLEQLGAALDRVPVPSC